MKHCLFCEKRIRPKKKHVRYCSPQCANKHKYRLYSAMILEIADNSASPKSKAEAKERGLKFYLSKPCHKKHPPVRLTNNGNCAVCKQERHAREWENRKAIRDDVEIEATESIMTAKYFFHLLPNWQHVVVERV